MGKAIEYIIEYRENGNKQYATINIDFISRGIARDYEALNARQEALSAKWKELVSNEFKANELEREKPEDWEMSIIELENKNAVLNKEIMAFNKDEFINDQHRLIQDILKDNGIKSELLLDVDFWERKVDLHDMMDFIHCAIYKDIDLKKKR